MKKSIYLAGAFVGVIVGAGFGSGQEILQFFTNFGMYSIPAILLSTVLFAFIGMQVAQLSSHLQATSHKEIITVLCGRVLGNALDIVLSFFLFGVGVIMIAGAGSIVEQQFGIPAFIGALGMTILAVLTMLLKIERIIGIISSITPFLLIIVIVIVAYALMKNGINPDEVNHYADVTKASASNWIMSGLLYVSFNVAVGFSMLSVIGGTFKDKKQAGVGGIIGGILLGVLLLLINAGMMTNFAVTQKMDMPTLYLANNISPIVGHLLSIILLAMIYNTCVGMFYSFTVRFVPQGRYFGISVSAVGLIGFALSFAGFTTLVNTVYPIMGYVGFVLLASVTWSWIRSTHHAPLPIGSMPVHPQKLD